MNKKTLQFILIVFITVLCFFAGYTTSNFLNSSSNDTISEVMSLIDEHYAGDFNKDFALIEAINGIVDSSKDEYASFRLNPKSEASIGISISFQDNYPIVLDVVKNSPAFHADIKVYDVLTKVNGISLEKKSILEITELFSGKIGDIKNITIERLKTVLDKQVTLAKTEQTYTYCETMSVDSKQIGYIKINSFQGNAHHVIQEFLISFNQLENIGGLIIDVRGNPGGSLDIVVDILNRIMPNDKKFLSLSNGDSFKSGMTKLPYQIIGLQDNFSASASEVLLAALIECGGYSTIGKTTYGKGVYQQTFDLKNIDATLSITTGKWFTPDGNNIDKVGVQPTIPLENNPLFDAYYPYYNHDINHDTVDSNLINVQLILKGLGFGDNIRQDGYFDDITLNALNNFQEENELRITNYYNFETHEILLEKYLDFQENKENDVIFQHAIERLRG